MKAKVVCRTKLNEASDVEFFPYDKEHQLAIPTKKLLAICVAMHECSFNELFDLLNDAENSHLVSSILEQIEESETTYSWRNENHLYSIDK